MYFFLKGPILVYEMFPYELALEVAVKATKIIPVFAVYDVIAMDLVDSLL